MVVKRTIHCLSGREIRGGGVVEGHENIKMATGSVVERPPSSLPSGEKNCLVPLSLLQKKNTVRIKITWERKICVRSTACPLVRGAWNCGNRGRRYRQSTLFVRDSDRFPDFSSPDALCF